MRSHRAVRARHNGGRHRRGIRTIHFASIRLGAAAFLGAYVAAYRQAYADPYAAALAAYNAGPFVVKLLLRGVPPYPERTNTCVVILDRWARIVSYEAAGSDAEAVSAPRRLR